MNPEIVNLKTCKGLLINDNSRMLDDMNIDWCFAKAAGHTEQVEKIEAWYKGRALEGAPEIEVHDMNYVRTRFNDPTYTFTTAQGVEFAMYLCIEKNEIKNMNVIAPAVHMLISCDVEDMNYATGIPKYEHFQCDISMKSLLLYDTASEYAETHDLPRLDEMGLLNGSEILSYPLLIKAVNTPIMQFAGYGNMRIAKYVYSEQPILADT